MISQLKTFIRKYKTIDLILYFIYTRFIFAKEVCFSYFIYLLIEVIKKTIIKNDISAISLTKNLINIELTDGRKFYWDPKDRTSLIGLGLKGINQKEETPYLKKYIKPGDTVFDIGANFGFHAVMFSNLVGSKGAVHSFEPLKEMYTLIKEHLKLNKSLDNTFVNRVALGNKKGKIKIFYYPELGTGLASLKKYWFGKAKEETASIVTLDSYVSLHKIKKLDFIKCNVEGSEYIVFQGAKET